MLSIVKRDIQFASDAICFLTVGLFSLFVAFVPLLTLPCFTLGCLDFRTWPLYGHAYPE